MPHIAIIEEARLRIENRELTCPNWYRRGAENLEFLYIGSRSGMEKRLIKSLNVPFKAIYTGKLRRYFSFENFLDLFKIPIGFFQSLYYLNKFHPDLVFSKGGYVSVPVVFAAFVLRKKVILHESDFSPGLANKICSCFASLILLSDKDSKKFFPNKKTEITGIPIRKFILNGDKCKAMEILKFDNKKPVLLIMGGSLGAQAINEVVFESLDEILKKFQIIHIVGKVPSTKYQVPSTKYQVRSTKYQVPSTKYQVPSTKYQVPSTKFYKQFKYVDKELPDFYALADVVLSRAGANTLAELASLRKKVLIIPLPKFASRGDQIENAQIFAKDYGGKVLLQENLTKDTLLTALDEVLNSRFDSSQEIIHLNARSKVLEFLL